jgi:hypothetical protein
MTEMTMEEISKELACQAIQHARQMLEAHVMTVKCPKPATTVEIKFNPNKDNSLALVPVMAQPQKSDGYDRCPLCSSDRHGDAGDGERGACGCPGEGGSDEDKKRWRERDANDSARDDVVANCMGLLVIAADMLRVGGDINDGWMLGSKQDFDEFVKASPSRRTQWKLDSIDSTTESSYSLLLFSKREFDEAIETFVKAQTYRRIQARFNPSTNPVFEDSYTYSFRPVRPGEARVGFVEMEFLPDNPPGRQYRFRVVE